MHVMKTKTVLYTVSNIFSHHIAHKFLPQSFDFHHFITHIHPSHYPIKESINSTVNFPINLRVIILIVYR